MFKHQPDQELMVIARSPFKIYYEGIAKRVSGSNRVGPFDVLPGHADFFSIMTPGEIVIDPSNGDQITFNATNGIITVRNNQVMLFANM